MCYILAVRALSMLCCSVLIRWCMEILHYNNTSRYTLYMCEPEQSTCSTKRNTVGKVVTGIVSLNLEGVQMTCDMIIVIL